MHNTPSEKRSAIMRSVKSKNTRPEIIVRQIIYSLGFRYRIHRKDLPGSPDIVFPGRKKAIFVHGCFWHWHGCKRSRMPKTNSEYWEAKIQRNQERDKRNCTALADIGWQALIVWECELKDKSTLEKKLVQFIG